MRKRSVEEISAFRQSLQITERFNECVDAAKTMALFKEIDYLEMLKPYTQILQAIMNAEKFQEAIPALLIVAKTNTFEENGMAQLLFIAATYELAQNNIKKTEKV